MRSVGERIYYQDDDCLIMGRGERSYDWGPGENTYRLYLLCRMGDEGDYGSDEFYMGSSVDLIKISSAERKVIDFEYCPMFDIVDPDVLYIRINEIMQQYPEAVRLTFNISKNVDICVEVYGNDWLDVERLQRM